MGATSLGTELRWPITDAAPVVVLRFAETAVEAQILDDWTRRSCSTDISPVVVDGDDLGDASSALDGVAEGAHLLPVRVAWTGTRTGGPRSWRDVAAAVNARVHIAGLQSRILAATPDQYQVVVGAPATRGELAERFERETNGSESFPAFVRRQAILALDRAERSGSEGPHKVPRLIMDEVKSSKRFTRSIEPLAVATGLAPDAVATRRIANLEEMAADHSRLAIEMFDRFGRFLTRAYGVSYDSAQLEKLRELNRSHSLVFLPSHRSYLDPFIVRAALIENRFPSNFCFGGNNMAFWPMGDWMRRTGNIVLRRNIGDDAIYKDTLRTYLQYLISKRLNFEWYIEGGRTRTGKLRPPKYGLLSYLVDAFDEMDDGQDVYLVPISLIYDGLPEASSLTAEQTGAQKKNEQISWLLNYPRSTGGGFGKVHLSVGEPLSLAAALEQEAGHERRVRVQKVAFEVCHRINEATPVTATALVTFALLGVGDRALTLTDIREVIAPLLAYVQQRGLPMTVDLTEPGELRAVLGWLSGTGVLVCYDGGVDTVWGIAPNRHLDAAFYRNSIIHHLVDRAILELVLAGVADGRFSTLRDGWHEALRLRDLLKFEFFFPDKREFFRRLGEELAVISPDWEEHLDDAAWWAATMAGSQPHVAHRTLHAYFEAYFVVADRLAAARPETPVDEKSFIRSCFGFARQRYMQQWLHSSDSISTEVLRNAYLAAGHRDLLGPGGEDLTKRRRAFADELGELLQRLQAVATDVPAELDTRRGR